MPREFSEAAEADTVGNEICHSVTIQKRNIANFEAGLARLDGNRKLFGDMIGFFREDVPQLVDDLEAALAENDCGKAKRAAHSIKGLAASFDAERVVGFARLIEGHAENNEMDGAARFIDDLKDAITGLHQAFDDFEAA